MAKNLRYIPAVGQIDPTACWMACLSWWLRAAHGVTKTQTDLMGLFGAVWGADGTINPTMLASGIQKNNAIFKMQTETIFPSSLSYWANGDHPTIIGFKTPAGFGHMNVVYGLKGEKIRAMEPWWPENLQIQYPAGDLPYIDESRKFTGMHVKRPVSYYETPLNGQSGLFIGIPQ